ncbi:UNVERIFIED_CONTAM: hypothetical protein K2H54_060544 [Gekko kuhli]
MEPPVVGGGAAAPGPPPASRRPPSCRRDCQAEQRRRVLPLKLSMWERKPGRLDARLRGCLRERLRLLENDDRKARAVFSELSARFLSVDPEEHLMMVTFWTFEEIWKFETYYSLGF